MVVLGVHVGRPAAGGVPLAGIFREDYAWPFGGLVSFGG